MPRKQAKAPDVNPKQPQEPAKRGGYGDTVNNTYNFIFGQSGQGGQGQPTGLGDLGGGEDPQKAAPGGTAPGSIRLN